MGNDLQQALVHLGYYNSTVTNHKLRLLQAIASFAELAGNERLMNECKAQMAALSDEHTQGLTGIRQEIATLFQLAMRAHADRIELAYVPRSEGCPQGLGQIAGMRGKLKEVCFIKQNLPEDVLEMCRTIFMVYSSTGESRYDPAQAQTGVILPTSVDLPRGLQRIEIQTRATPNGGHCMELRLI